MKLENIKHDLTLPAVKGLNVAALTAAFFLGWSLFYVGFMGSTALKWTGYILSGLFFFHVRPVWKGLRRVYDLHKPDLRAGLQPGSGGHYFRWNDVCGHMPADAPLDESSGDLLCFCGTDGFGCDLVHRSSPVVFCLIPGPAFGSRL